MKAFKNMVILAFVGISSTVFASSKADSLGLPGDNFDLYAALELFKKSDNPEAFEKAINSSDNEINNLDLNADGKVDYVKVLDKSKDDSHSLVLQVDVSPNEVQDVAVIETEKTGAGNAHLQIVGDEELYGKNYIIEPKDNTASTASSPAKTTQTQQQADDEDDVYRSSGNNNSTNNNSANYNSSNYNSGPPVVVNVWAWPSVQYMYMPAYTPWVSPWYWGYYPGWWQPWGPIYWRSYYRRAYRWHQPYYHRTNYYSCQVAHNYYYGRRSSSITVSGYNKSGFYAKKQMAYRENMDPGRKYNSAPANVETQQVINKREANEQKSFNNTQQNKINSQPVKEQNQVVNEQKANNSAPKQFDKPKEQSQISSQPHSINTEPKKANAQSQQINTQPQQNVQKQPAMSIEKPQRSAEPVNRPAKQQNIGGGGGGGMRQGGGGGGGRRGR